MNSKIIYTSPILIILFISIRSIGQIAPDTYWVQFTNKDFNSYSLERPHEFLSERAIERRNKQNIQYNISDLPVSKYYIDSLLSLGLEIRNVSKWFNGVVIRSVDNDLLDTLHHISFIANPVQEKSYQAGNFIKVNKFDTTTLKEAITYGYSETQIKMLNGNILHTNGFNGENMLIGVIDAGFSLTNEIESLEHLWTDNRIIAWKDFVKDGKGFFLSHSHGTTVLSIMAGTIPNYMYGSATGANYVLIRTEDGSGEYLVEEYNWACGAEYADSIGVDVINSSLGYSVFNDPNQDHSYEDMDGKTTPVSCAALMAARKGILVSSSAGNSGGDINWGYITAPGDTDSILTVGAVDSTRTIAVFSGRGPSYDKRVKPDVCAMGINTISQSSPNVIKGCNGTSCSSPVIAGLSACLWQANPTATAQQIRKAILTSSHLYNSPDTIWGYGIPDFYLANLILQHQSVGSRDLTKISIVPNPVENSGYLVTDFPWLDKKSVGTISFFDLHGRLLFQYNQYLLPGPNINTLVLPINLEKGNYLIKVCIEDRFYNATFIKL